MFRRTIIRILMFNRTIITDLMQGIIIGGVLAGITATILFNAPVTTVVCTGMSSDLFD